MYNPFEGKDPTEQYPAMKGGTDTLLSKGFLVPGGRSFNVGPNEASAIVTSNLGTREDPFMPTMAYSAALRTALEAQGLQGEGLEGSNYWIYRGDQATIQRLAMQAAEATGTTLDAAFLSRLGSVAVNQLTHFVTVYFRAEA